MSFKLEVSHLQTPPASMDSHMSQYDGQDRLEKGQFHTSEEFPARVRNMQGETGAYYTQKSARERDVHRRSNAANVVPMGLFGFGLTTALVQGAFTTTTELHGTKALTWTFGFFYGGLTQFLAGMWSVYKGETLDATVFTLWGSFWLGYGFFGILNGAGIFGRYEQPGYVPLLPEATGEGFGQGLQFVLSLWGVVTFICFSASFRKAVPVQLTLLLLAVLAFLIAGGVTNSTCEKVAGWWGLVTAGVAFWAAAAELLKSSYGTPVLPAGPWTHVGRFLSLKWLANLKVFFLALANKDTHGTTS